MLGRELTRKRWLIGRPKGVQALHVVDVVPLATKSPANPAYVLLLRIDFLEGESEMYLLPLTTAWSSDAERIAATSKSAIIASAIPNETGEAGIIYDAAGDPATATALLDLVINRRRLKGSCGELVGSSSASLAELGANLAEAPVQVAIRSEPANSFVAFGDKLLLKIFRRLESGVNPDLEISRFLSQPRIAFPHILPLYGAVEYHGDDGDSATIALVHGRAHNSVPGRKFAEDTLWRFFEQVMALPGEAREALSVPTGVSLWELSGGDAPAAAKEHLGATLEWAALLGRRTAEMHVALTADSLNAAFAPEPYSQLFQRSLYQSSRKLTLQTFARLRRQARSLSEELQPLVHAVLESERLVLERFRAIVGKPLEGQRIRCHGDYDLDHVLYTGKDFLIVNFEGKPNQSLAARRSKQSPLADVAAMFHSFQRAATESVLRLPTMSVGTPETVATWRRATRFWHVWCTSAFLRRTRPSPGRPNCCRRVWRA